MTRAGKGQLLFFVSGALAVALALGYAFWPAPIVVDTAKVTTGPLRVTIDEDGEIRAHDRYVVTAPITGRLLRVMLREGDRVRAGEVIAVLVPVPMTPGENAQQRARARSRPNFSKTASNRKKSVSGWDSRSRFRRIGCIGRGRIGGKASSVRYPTPNRSPMKRWPRQARLEIRVFDLPKTLTFSHPPTPEFPHL